MGALAGGASGMLAWYFLITWTGYEIGYAAWGVGILTGFVTRLLAGQGDKLLAVVSSGCAFVAIIGGQYLVVKNIFDAQMDTFLSGAYDKQVTFARAALKAQSDEELKALLAKKLVTGSQPATPNAVTSQEIETFRKQQLPKLAALVNGKPSKSEYEAYLRKQLNSPAIKARLLKNSVGLFTLLWLFLGVGSAYRLAARTD